MFFVLLYKYLRLKSAKKVHLQPSRCCFLWFYSASCRPFPFFQLSPCPWRGCVYIYKVCCGYCQVGVQGIAHMVRSTLNSAVFFTFPVRRNNFRVTPENLCFTPTLRLTHDVGYINHVVGYVNHVVIYVNRDVGQTYCAGGIRNVCRARRFCVPLAQVRHGQCPSAWCGTAGY